MPKNDYLNNLEEDSEESTPNTTPIPRSRPSSGGGNNGGSRPSSGGGGGSRPSGSGGGYNSGGNRSSGGSGGGYNNSSGGNRSGGGGGYNNSGGGRPPSGGGGNSGPRPGGYNNNPGGSGSGGYNNGPRPSGGDNNGPRPGGYNNNSGTGGGGYNNGPRPGGGYNGNSGTGGSGYNNGPRPGGYNNSGGDSGGSSPRPAGGGYNNGPRPGGGDNNGPRPAGGGYNNGPRPGGGYNNGPRAFNGPRPGGAPVAVPTEGPIRDRSKERERDRGRELARDKEFERDGGINAPRRPGPFGGNNGRPNGFRPGPGAGGIRGGVAAPPRTGVKGIIKKVEIYELPPVMTVKELADELGVGFGEIIRKLIDNGVMASINQQIDYDTAAIVAAELGFETHELAPVKTDRPDEIKVPSKDEIAQDPEAIVRPPIVTIMGHVDHGKTKLLDAIRSTNVVAGEAGGITQHIGAYQVEIQGKKITFLDTPGHEAFTQMRARGAQVTDIAILVVAADDGVKPQTLEALSHAKAANVPIIVAINKIDREGANPERVKQQLNEAGLMPEEWGGDTPYVEVSAREKIGIDNLLEMILLVAELGELKANPNKPAVGTIIEAELDKNRGPIATVLVQNGTLELRDYVVVGNIYGRIKDLRDDKGRRMRKVEPGSPAEILGLEDVPRASDILQVVSDEKIAKQIIDARRRASVTESQTATKPISLEDLNNRIQAGKIKQLEIILKADVQGSIEAIRSSLEKLSTEQVKIRILLSGTGAINESDVMLASASTNGAIIIGFNARPDPAGKRAADVAKIDVRFYNIIYNLIDDIKAAMAGLLEPTYKDVTDGYAEVRQVFTVGKNQAFAGIFVTDGKAMRSGKVRVLRNGIVMYDNEVGSLKRFKDDVREVQTGYECGIGLGDFNDFQISDTLEFYHTETVKAQTL